MSKIHVVATPLPLLSSPLLSSPPSPPSPPPSPQPQPPENKNKNGLALVVNLESIADTPPSCYDGGKLPAVLGISLYAPRGNGVHARKVVVSDDTGAVRLYFAKNGTMMRSFDLQVPQTSNSIAKTGVTLAIGTGPDVSFVHASKADKVLSRCDGISGTTVVSVAYDVLIPSYLYAGLDNGDVLVFDTKFRPNKQTSSSKATCKLLYKVTSGGEMVDGVFGLKGYLLSTASATNSMTVHNTTSAREQKTRYVVDNSATLKGRPYSGYGVAVSEGSGNKIEVSRGLTVRDNNKWWRYIISFLATRFAPQLTPPLTPHPLHHDRTSTLRFAKPTTRSSCTATSCPTPTLLTATSLGSGCRSSSWESGSSSSTSTRRRGRGRGGVGEILFR